MKFNNMHGNANDAEFCKMCPLCNNRVRFFYLAMNEKILMCENIKCEFPFGYNDFKIIKEEDDCFGMSRRSATNTSLKSWRDIDRNGLEIPNEVKCFNVTHEDSNIQVIEEKIASDKEMVKELQAIKGLTKKFNEFEEDSDDIIKNKKFINKLMKLQKLSGMKLVKREEMEVLKRDKPKSDELKIDIDTSGSNLCAITIEITQNNVPNVT